MRDNISGDIISAVTGRKIVTALCVRLDFKSETVFVWTGVGAFAPATGADELLDGNVFSPLYPGIIGDIGENTFSYSGSGELTLTLAVPSQPDISIAAASVYPNEYQSRPATVWRAIQVYQPDPLAPPTWVCRRIRSGKMDKVEITQDGQSHNFTLTIESHQGSLSNASNQTYLNQRSYDANDSSQDYAVSIANGSPSPTKSSALIGTGSSVLRDKLGNETGDLAID